MVNNMVVSSGNLALSGAFRRISNEKSFSSNNSNSVVNWGDGWSDFDDHVDCPGE